MSFRCQICTQTFPNENSAAFAPERVVTATRRVSYFNKEQRGETFGVQVAQERAACPTCAVAATLAGPKLLPGLWRFVEDRDSRGMELVTN